MSERGGVTDDCMQRRQQQTGAREASDSRARWLWCDCWLRGIRTRMRTGCSVTTGQVVPSELTLLDWQWQQQQQQQRRRRRGVECGGEWASFMGIRFGTTLGDADGERRATVEAYLSWPRGTMAKSNGMLQGTLRNRSATWRSRHEAQEASWIMQVCERHGDERVAQAAMGDPKRVRA